MKPFRETLTIEPGASWSRLNRRLADVIPFEWHHHPEYELTLTLNSKGQRFVGDHIGDYGHGDLALLGPNLPHTWASSGKLDDAQDHVALVMWFSPQWAWDLTTHFAELAHLSRMFSQASRGLDFSPRTKQSVHQMIVDLFDLSADQRFLALIKVLTILAQDRDAQPLASPAVFDAQSSILQNPRLDRVLDFVHEHYASDTSLAQVADIAALSPSGVHRLFKRHMQASFSDYVMRLRIGKACAILASTNRPVAAIADDVGYRSLANFNRQFKRLKGQTPRDYRNSFGG